MLHVWYSNQLENLVRRLIDNLREETPGFPGSAFAKRSLVIPNANIQTYLQFAIARTTGIAANLEFLFLEKFLAGLVPADVVEVRPLDRTVLQNLILGALDEPSRSPPGPLSQYLADLIEDARDLRRFHLAAELARLFESYSFSRTELLQDWLCGQDHIQDEPFAATEQWQRPLWCEI